MQRHEAHLVALRITDEQLRVMLETAKDKVADWRRPSRVNKSISKGTAWNLLTKAFKEYTDGRTSLPLVTKINLLLEFGDFLPKKIRETKPKKGGKGDERTSHQEPDFTGI
jgi:hypothetical protein